MQELKQGERVLVPASVVIADFPPGYTQVSVCGYGLPVLVETEKIARLSASVEITERVGVQP